MQRIRHTIEAWLSSVKPIAQTAIPSILPIPLFCLHQARFSEVAYRPSGGGFGEFQVFGYGGNGRPADAVFVGTIGKIYVHGDGPVGQIHSV